jgi:hypothetical protein
MPLFPAVKLKDIVIGVDVHNVAPPSGIPHLYFGPIYLWHDPTFPKANVFINGLPACSVGAMGYWFHVPQGVPVAPTPTNVPYWKRYILDVGMATILMVLTILANIAIAGIASKIPKPKSAEKFIKDVTAIDTSNSAATWKSINASFANLVKWQSWVTLLLAPIPYCGANGSTAVGSPKVTVNGGALAFAAPLMGTSCSDIPVVPNASILGFTNVYVGVSIADMIRGLEVSIYKSAIKTVLKRGRDRAKTALQNRKGKQSSGCG